MVTCGRHGDDVAPSLLGELGEATHVVQTGGGEGVVLGGGVVVAYSTVWTQ